jgi:tRNA 2-selenouridine synthase
MSSQGTRIASVAEIATFDEVIDARTPAEFAEDHVPGAINLPVLDNAERARVGTLYKQVSSFEAKKIGAALVSRNIAQHLERHFADKPKSYRPLIYCWRGGGRSGAMAHVLHKIGYAAAQLDGGYKAYRRQVVADLATLPASHCYRVVTGPTGSGKSRLLQALATLGAQVLDLEQLAAHRGSVLGSLPGQPQPSQKNFESAIWQRLRRFSSDRPVYVESESRKIGTLRVPEGLITRMRASPCVRIEASLDARITLLIEEYRHYLDTPEPIVAQLGLLTPLRGNDAVANWQSLARAGRWPELVAALLKEHYDPAYMRSLSTNYAARDDDWLVEADDLSEPAMRQLAERILALPQDC